MPAVLTSPAAMTLTRVDPGCIHALTEPTLASAWQAVAGTTIGDELLEWPPDLFALTEVILERSEAYRFALSPPAGAHWPPASVPGWPDAVTDAARQWSARAENRHLAIPALLAQEWRALRTRAGILRRERPPDQGVQHRHPATPCTSRPTTPADADSR